MKNQPIVRFHRPSIGREEIDEVVATLESGWLTTGPRTATFEKEFAAYVGAPHALAVNSGTAAMHLALAALGIGPGDEVITTPLTFCATVNCILHVGATPVLADVADDGNIDPASIAERITGRTRAILPVHLGGLPCDMDSIWSLARRRRLRVIEDCAHAAGSLYRGTPLGGRHGTGGLSDAAAFSFYVTKNMTTGEGGMVVSHDPEVAERMRVLCLHGINKDAWNRYSERGNWWYEVLQCGFKYNLSDIQSAIGLHQLRKLDGFIEVRTRYAQMYNEAFADVEEVEVPPQLSYCRHSWHLYGLRLNPSLLAVDRDEFITRLRRRNVCTSVHFIPVPLHPYFAKYAALPHNHCPRALQLYLRLVSLPLYPAMTEKQVRYVARVVKDVVQGAKRKKRVRVSSMVSAAGGANV
jgi:dTDP-4-amino-4,6-dideoxygalactose transaminase